MTVIELDEDEAIGLATEDELSYNITLKDRYVEFLLIQKNRKNESI